jgi:peroxiredoxin
MTAKTTLMAMLLALFIGLTSSAGEFNKRLNVGDAAPTWTNLPGTDDKTHSTSELKQKDVIVVVFTCNSCPIAVDYEDRLLAFSRKYCGPDGKVALVAINVNKIADDSMDKMKERSKSKGFSFPYLFDATQKIARDFGADYTPEFFVINKARQIAYMGAMDDRTKASDVKTNYLDAAVEATLKGQKCAPPETLARGCKIRFDRERK